MILFDTFWYINAFWYLYFWFFLKHLILFYFDTFDTFDTDNLKLFYTFYTFCPLIYWCNTWTEGELLDDFHDMFQIIKIYFSIIVRNIFWGVFKEIRAWFRKKFISLLITSSIWPQILALCFNSPTLSLPSVSMSAFWLRPPHPPPKRQQYQHFGSDPPPPQTCWCNTWTLP